MYLNCKVLLYKFTVSDRSDKTCWQSVDSFSFSLIAVTKRGVQKSLNYYKIQIFMIEIVWIFWKILYRNRCLFICKSPALFVKATWLLALDQADSFSSRYYTCKRAGSIPWNVREIPLKPLKSMAGHWKISSFIFRSFFIDELPTLPIEIHT